MIPQNKTTKSTRRGFSLLELSIVLGVVGIALGGVWAAVASSRTNMMANQLEQQTSLFVSNVRSYYSGRALPTTAMVAADFTPLMAAANAYPGDMCNTTCATSTFAPFNAFGGTANSSIPSVGSAPYGEFQIIYSRVPKKACISFGSSLSANAPDSGLTYFQVGSTTAVTSFPVTLPTLNTNCAASNSLTLRFRIRL